MSTQILIVSSKGILVNSNKLITSLYRKKTFSGVYMNYNSFLPVKYKKGLIHTLLFRALQYLCRL